MPKGNKLAYLNSPMTDNSPIDFDDNKNMIELCLDIYNSKIPDLSNEKEVQTAINNYFTNCINRGLRPGNLGLYAALGLDRRQVKDLLDGRIKLNASSSSLRHIKKAQEMLSTFREVLGAQGKLNPATLIFWAKNFDGLSDVQQIDINPMNIQPNKTPEEIAAEIDDIPTD